MFHLKFIASAIVLMACFYGWSNATDDDNKEIDCTITRKCSTNEDIVWAVDNEQCYLYRNPCIFATEMCRRRVKNKTGNGIDFKYLRRNVLTFNRFSFSGEYF